jgi:hypothetical protein
LQGLREKETIPLLENFVKKFPYCQSAHLLLAKALHEQDNIHYDEQLQIAAAYAPDREALKNLIDKKIQEVEFEFPPKNNETDANAIRDYHSTGKPIGKAAFEEWYSDEEISGRAFEEQREKEKLIDPHEVIRKRLNEILGTSPPASRPAQTGSGQVKPDVRPAETRDKDIDLDRQEVKPSQRKEDQEEEIYIEDHLAENKIEEERLHPEPEKSEEEKSILAEAAKARDVLDKLELEHAMEESILDSISRMPALEPVSKEPESGIKQADSFSTPKEGSKVTAAASPKSFMDWLRSIPKCYVSGFEEVKAPILEEISHPDPGPIAETTENFQETEAQLSDDELIEKFLLSDPKIVPSKAEFYSPIAQAKKSVMDHEDVVSETLAQIYLRQGNTRKARWCYEKLMLLHPEKSAFFAALLKEIEDQTNSKEDL